MKVILSEDIPNLGEEGDVKVVANGYARNYLLPKNMVKPYSKQNIVILERNKEVIEKRKEEKRKAALGLKERLEGEQLVIEMPAGESGKLFGSVTTATIIEALQKLNYEIEKKKIEIPGHTIKMIGDFTIKVKLYGKEEASLNVTIKGAESNA